MFLHDDSCVTCHPSYSTTARSTAVFACWLSMRPAMSMSASSAILPVLAHFAPVVSLCVYWRALCLAASSSQLIKNAFYFRVTLILGLRPETIHLHPALGVCVSLLLSRLGWYYCLGLAVFCTQVCLISSVLDTLNVGQMPWPNHFRSLGRSAYRSFSPAIRQEAFLVRG